MTLGRLTGVPVLAYHRIVAAASSSVLRYNVRDAALRQQLQLLRDLPVAAVGLDDIAGSHVPEKSVALTFDDGYSSDYEIAFRLLSEFAVTATFFVITGNVGSDGFLSWRMATEMVRNGMRFGSHSHQHVALTTLAPERLKVQLQTSRQMLEQNLGCAITVLAVPYGFCDQHVLSAAWEAGYRIVCTSRPWPAQVGSRVLSRAGVFENTSLEEFRKLVENDPSVYLRRWGRDRALALPKFVFLRLRPQVLGVRTVEDHL